MRVDRDEVDAWGHRWGISSSTCEVLWQRGEQDGAVPPVTGMPPTVVTELQVLPLRALGQLRDLFVPELYPPSR